LIVYVTQANNNSKTKKPRKTEVGVNLLWGKITSNCCAKLELKEWTFWVLVMVRVSPV